MNYIKRLVLWLFFKTLRGESFVARFVNQVTVHGHTIFIPDVYALRTYREIFEKEEYKLSLSKAPEVIFDIGSNLGYTALYFHHHYPDATIYCFEPDPRAFEVLKKNTETLSAIHCFNMAIAGEEGVIDFFTDPLATSSSSMKERTDREGEKTRISVTAKTLDGIMDELNIKHIDLLKFDIEGAEEYVFPHTKNLKNIDTIIGEVHTDLIDMSKESFLKLFEDFPHQTITPQKKGRFLLLLER